MTDWNVSDIDNPKHKDFGTPQTPSNVILDMNAAEGAIIHAHIEKLNHLHWFNIQMHNNPPRDPETDKPVVYVDPIIWPNYLVLMIKYLYTDDIDPEDIKEIALDSERMYSELRFHTPPKPKIPKDHHRVTIYLIICEASRSLQMDGLRQLSKNRYQEIVQQVEPWIMYNSLEWIYTVQENLKPRSKTGHLAAKAAVSCKKFMKSEYFQRSVATSPAFAFDFLDVMMKWTEGNFDERKGFVKACVAGLEHTNWNPENLP